MRRAGVKRECCQDGAPGQTGRVGPQAGSRWSTSERAVARAGPNDRDAGEDRRITLEERSLDGVGLATTHSVPIGTHDVECGSRAVSLELFDAIRRARGYLGLARPI